MRLILRFNLILNRAADGLRTRNFQLGKLVRYLLRHSREYSLIKSHSLKVNRNQGMQVKMYSSVGIL